MLRRDKIGEIFLTGAKINVLMHALRAYVTNCIGYSGMTASM